MDSWSTEIINEIAEQLDSGCRAFIHKTNGQLHFVLDNSHYPDVDFDAWDEESEELENNFTEYYEIEKWTSSEAFEMMAEFAEQLTDNELQGRLFYALSKNKPFSRFKFIIDNSGDFRQKWFAFKDKWQQNYVARQLDLLEPTDE